MTTAVGECGGYSGIRVFGYSGLSRKPANLHARIPGGFTLVEMLVVIGIISLLAAIIFPVFGAIRDSRYRNTCVSNLMILGQSLKLYQYDYHAFPPDITEGGYGLYTLYELRRRGIADYLNRWDVFRCPASLSANQPDWAGLGPVSGPLWWDWPAPPVGTGTKTTAPLGLYNTYDAYDDNGDGTIQAGEVRYQRTRTSDPTFKRQLNQGFPPGDTVVTWCPLHPGPKDTIVLFLDGSVSYLTHSAPNYWEETLP